MEFAYIDVKDKYRDGKDIFEISVFDTRSIFQFFVIDQTRSLAWVLDDDPGHKNLLKFAIGAENFPKKSALHLYLVSVKLFFMEPSVDKESLV